MFLEFKKLNNESGVVLFIVLMVAIVIMIFSVGILNQSMNEIHYGQDQVKQIQCQEQSMGFFSSNFSPFATSGTVPAGCTQNLATGVYTCTFTCTVPG